MTFGLYCAGKAAVTSSPIEDRLEAEQPGCPGPFSYCDRKSSNFTVAATGTALDFGDKRARANNGENDEIRLTPVEKKHYREQRTDLRLFVSMTQATFSFVMWSDVS